MLSPEGPFSCQLLGGGAAVSPRGRVVALAVLGALGAAEPRGSRETRHVCRGLNRRQILGEPPPSTKLTAGR